MGVLNFWYNYLETIQFDLQMSIFDFDRQVAWFLMKYTPVLLNEQTNRSKKYASPHFLSQNFSGKQFWSKSEHFWIFGIKNHATSRLKNIFFVIFLTTELCVPTYPKSVTTVFFLRFFFVRQNSAGCARRARQLSEA